MQNLRAAAIALALIPAGFAFYAVSAVIYAAPLWFVLWLCGWV